MLRPTHALALVLLALLALPALAQSSSPYYLGGSVGISHVSNIYRTAGATNGDRVISTGLLAGLDQRFGRQHLTVDGSIQDNRYAENSGLNNQSYALRSALEWQTAGRLSGTLSASNSRSLADFNIGAGVEPIFKKNTEREAEYAAIVRLGVTTRYSLEAGLNHRRRNFSAPEYDRLTSNQNTGSLGVYATPGANVRLGLVARHTQGTSPRYPTGIFFNAETLKFEVRTEPNDFTRNDIDFTTSWTTGGSSTLNTRISASRTRNSLSSVLRDFSGTTGLVGWNWQATSKLGLRVQVARDTGQETIAQATDINRVYNSWQLGATYALTAKLSANANASQSRSRRDNNTFDDDSGRSLGLRWAYSRSFNLVCQVNRASRDSSTPQYVYSASSYGCTGQAILY